MTDEEFTRAIRDTGLDARAIASSAGVSVLTAKRWLNGLTTPHEIVHVSIMRALAEVKR